MKSTLISGQRARNSSARVLPDMPGMTTSVRTRWQPPWTASARRSASSPLAASQTRHPQGWGGGEAPHAVLVFYQEHGEFSLGLDQFEDRGGSRLCRTLGTRQMNFEAAPL